MPRGLWDLPGPGIEAMSPALAGRFPTTGPPGKSSIFSFVHFNTVGHLSVMAGWQDGRPQVPTVLQVLKAIRCHESPPPPRQ